MVTIAGSGMGPYDFSNINLDLTRFELIFCDKNYKTDLPNVIQGSFKEVKEQLLANLEKNILYVVSGSPFFFSGAAVIITMAKKQNIPFRIIDNTSSLSYMLSYVGVALTKTAIASLHGKNEVDLENFLTKEYTFFVCDENTPKNLSRIMHYLEKKDVTITVGERFGYEDERFYEASLEELLQNPPKMPYSLLLHRNFTPPPPISSEEEIEHENGMITKTYKRHLSLQNLNLEPNMLLWDIGAGSGSVSIDGYKRYKVRTVMFEKNEKRAAMIERNLTKHKVVDTKLYIGEASELYRQEKSTPQRIFVGGGGEKVINELDYLYDRLSDGGRLVANFVTLQHLTTAINVLKKSSIPFEIKSISLTTYKMSLLLPEPERVMHQIIIDKETNDTLR